jgi:hypothetical protein
MNAPLSQGSSEQKQFCTGGKEEKFFSLNRHSTEVELLSIVSRNIIPSLFEAA